MNFDTEIINRKRGIVGIFVHIIIPVLESGVSAMEFMGTTVQYLGARSWHVVVTFRPTRHIVEHVGHSVETTD